MGDDQPAGEPGPGTPPGQTSAQGVPPAQPPPWGWSSPPPPAWGPPPWGGGTSGWGPAGAQGGPPAWGPPPPPGWGAPGSAPWPGQPGSTPSAPGSDLPTRHRGLRLVALVLGAAVLAAAVGVPVAILVSQGGAPSAVTSPATSPTPNSSQRAASAQASALYAQALTAAEKSAGFTYTSTSSGGGATLTVTGVSGQDAGSQVFNQTTSFGDEKFTLLLVPDQTVYFQGNAAAAEDQLGVSASAASGVAGQWVSVQIGDGPYKNLEVGITVGSQLSEAVLDATSTETVTGSGGTQLTRILGTVPGTSSGTAHLDISPTTHLPVSYVVPSSDGGGTETETFTAWGTAPSLTTPSTAVAWSTLSTSEPAGGYGGGQTATPAPTPTPAGAST